MKSQLCCVRLVAFSLSLVLGTSVFAHADKGALEQLNKIIAANSLDASGKAPFHIKIAFQYFDLEGKPVETGTAEEWWVSPTQYRTVVVSPSLNEVFPSPDGGAPQKATREAFLVHELLGAAVHPVPRYKNFDELDVSLQKRNADGVGLTCVMVEHFSQMGPSLTTPTMCAETSSMALRLRTNANASSVARNSIGVFHDVNVSLDMQISYGVTKHEQMAMTGHVTVLTTFDPSKSTLALGAPPPDRFDQEDIPEVYMKGKILDRAPIKYPSNSGFDGGLVAMRGMVMKDGSVTGVVAMSSPNKALTDAAIESWSKCKYAPYRIGETPVEVYANYFINFAVIHSTHIPVAVH